MSYSVGQYNFVGGKAETENFLINLPTGYKATRFPAVTNSGVESMSQEYPFDEECLWYSGAVNEGFKIGHTYYVHCRILQLDTNQTFNIKLAHMSPSPEEADEVQFLKRIVVQKNSIGSVSYDIATKKAVVTPGNNWVDFELVFTPLENFDTLIFDLVRTVADGDYDTDTMRFPCIIYNEICTVENPFADFKRDDITIVKIGVQSHPGLFMVVNHEPIKIGRSGSYELRSELLEGIDSFAVVEAATDDNINSDMLTLATKISTQIFIRRHEPLAYKSIQTDNYITVEAYEEFSPYKKLGYEPIYLTGNFILDKWAEGEDSPSSSGRTSVAKSRETSNFVLDYMYKINEE